MSQVSIVSCTFPHVVSVGISDPSNTYPVFLAPTPRLTGVTRAITTALAKPQPTTSYNDTRLNLQRATSGLGKDDLVNYGADQ